jgi:hypothetical protein
MGGNCRLQRFQTERTDLCQRNRPHPKRALPAFSWFFELVTAQHVDPQPFIEGGYSTEHQKFIAGATHVGYRHEAILGYAYDFNKTWRVQVDFESGSGNSSTLGFTCNVTRDLQFNPAIYVTNDSPHHVLGYIVFTYTFHLWGSRKETVTPSGK